MLVSAIVVTLLLMSTASTMAEIQEGQNDPMKQGYYLDTVRELGEKLDLAKESDRTRFRHSVGQLESYSTEYNFWRARRCYNITMENSQSELRLRCVGNGSVFHDSFEDGEFRDQGWMDNGNGMAEVETAYGPETGNQALSMKEDQGSEMRILWERNTSSWSGPWSTEGLFYTEEIDPNTRQENRVLMYQDGLTGGQGLRLELGISDSSGNPLPATIEGPLINSPDSQSISWSEDSWYRWELEHDGNGNYTAWIWETSGSKPASPTMDADGQPPGNEMRTGGFEISGSSGVSYKILQAYMRFYED